MKARPLSDDKEILRLMKAGWGLVWYDGCRTSGSYWLTKKGEEHRKVHASTIFRMFRDKTIEPMKETKDTKFWRRHEVEIAVHPAPVYCTLAAIVWILFWIFH